ncbi:carbohydrate ABC transporter permease [Gorillibacterium timonense]|uniref:carbohydrate ABC transporter permease n=1 Tax=Gorillibacterium timonense TaxID=1689269 RepID=UPI00071D3A65|nr:sugar ABC transporter permease [Gorillibacterium timonense]
MKMRLTLTRKRSLLGLLFISPWLIGFLVLFLKPLIESIRYSFNKLVIDPTGFKLVSVGWSNFHNALFVDANFNRILTESVLDMVINVPLILFFSLFSAVLLNQKFRGRAMARAIFFLPVILASGAISAAESAGLINLVGNAAVAEDMNQASQFNAMPIVELLLHAGFPGGIIDYVVEAVMRIYEVIRSSGVQILIFLAALQSVPTSMYEVAKMEGATGYETFWKITFPMVSPLILTNIIYTIIDSFADSSVTQIIYQTAFTSQNFGLSAAMSWLYTLAVSIMLVLIGIAISRKVFYQN